jgi:hypothetical protein
VNTQRGEEEAHRLAVVEADALLLTQAAKEEAEGPAVAVAGHTSDTWASLGYCHADCRASLSRATQ